MLVHVSVLSFVYLLTCSKASCIWTPKKSIYVIHFFFPSTDSSKFYLNPYGRINAFQVTSESFQINWCLSLLRDDSNSSVFRHTSLIGVYTTYSRTLVIFSITKILCFYEIFLNLITIWITVGAATNFLKTASGVAKGQVALRSFLLRGAINPSSATENRHYWKYFKSSDTGIITFLAPNASHKRFICSLIFYLAAWRQY